jgi:hypothetical protein
LHACEGAIGIGHHSGGRHGNGDSDVGREIAKAFRGAGAWGGLDRGEEEKDVMEKIFFHA